MHWFGANRARARARRAPDRYPHRRLRRRAGGPADCERRGLRGGVSLPRRTLRGRGTRRSTCPPGARVGDELEVASILRTLADAKLWRLSVGSGFYLYAQLAVIGFAVLFLHDEHGLSEGGAALVIAASQVLAMAFRIGAGRWSDVVGSRVGPLLRVGLAVAASVGLTAVLADGPLWLLVPAIALAGGLSMAWNGLSYTAAAELAGPVRSGAAIGLQQTVLGGAGVVAPRSGQGSAEVETYQRLLASNQASTSKSRGDRGWRSWLRWALGAGGGEVPRGEIPRDKSSPDPYKGTVRLCTG